MPVYLVHGFRWPRDGFSGIRVHAIVHNLEDCSVEYIQNANSREELLGSFRKNYVDLMKEIESGGRTLDFIEQYDPNDESDAAVIQPYAYVADKVVELAGQSIQQHRASIDKTKPKAPLLSVNVEEVIANGPGLSSQAWEALADLRDKIAEGEKIGWWVVYNGDPERAYDSDEDDYIDEEDEEEATTPTAETAQGRTPQIMATTVQTTPSVATAHSSVTTAGKGGVVPPQMQQNRPAVPPKNTASEGTTLSSKLLPSRKKAEIIKPEAVLPSPKKEDIPEPPKLKETAKSGGLRKKFFGKKL